MLFRRPEQLPDTRLDAALGTKHWPLEEKAAKERQREAGRTRGRGKIASGNLPGAKGQATDKAAKASAATYSWCLKERTSHRWEVLIPLIESELQQGNSAGHEHYRRAGEMLIEAKDQVGHGGWTRWLSKNFELSQRTASVYMQWARHANEQSGRPPADLKRFSSLQEMRGDTERRREDRRSSQQQAFRRVLRDVARDDFVQQRQARDEEVRLHRELAEELINLGYRALATKLHPDRGGSKDAMARLNRVRDELKQMAQTRRFV